MILLEIMLLSAALCWQVELTRFI